MTDCFVLLDNVPYRKNYFQNRNRIRTKTGWIWLTVPVYTKGNSGQLISEVMIDNQTNPHWKKKHWQTILQNYRTSPYFDEYSILLESIYHQNWQRLSFLNEVIIKYFAEKLGIKCELIRASSLDVIGTQTDLLVAICEKIGADVYLSGKFGKEYLDESKFTQHGIGLQYHDFHHPIYRQLSEPFIPEMSVIDLLFNEGVKSQKILIS